MKQQSALEACNHEHKTVIKGVALWCGNCGSLGNGEVPTVWTAPALTAAAPACDRLHYTVGEPEVRKVLGFTDEAVLPATEPVCQFRYVSGNSQCPMSEAQHHGRGHKFQPADSLQA